MAAFCVNSLFKRITIALITTFVDPFLGREIIEESS